MSTAPSRSLLWRIVTLHVVALIAASAAMLAAVVALLNTTFTREQHRTLRRHETAIARAVSHDNGVWDLNLPPDLRDLYANGYAGFAFSVIDDQGKVVFSRPRAAALFPSSMNSARPQFFEERRGIGYYSGASFPEQSHGARYWVQIAQDLTNPDAIVDDVVLIYLRQIGWLLAPILLGLGLIDVFIVRRALQPVLDASERAGAIAPTNLKVRLPAARLPREIEPLVQAVNQALDRLEEGFNRQREFTADAAHELRTPLAILRMRVEALKDREITQPLLSDIDAMTRVVSQLLEMAELDALILDPDLTTDLHDLCERVVTYMAPYALARGKRIALIGHDQPVWVHGDPDILFQAVRNLVENAIEHTPPKRGVEVEVLEPDRLRVLDNGPGFAEDEAALIFRRFWRRDRRKSKGAGLGLSIVSRIIDAHGGEVSVANRPNGGAAFTLRLRPLSPRQVGES